MARRDADERWLRLIEAEYREMPGMALTRRQIRRLWGLEEERCGILLDQLVSTGVLQQLESEVFVRRDRQV